MAGKFLAQLAQLVEQKTENLRVAGSIPALGTILGSIAQLGEHLPYKQGVTGSSPVVPTKNLSDQGNLVAFLFYFSVSPNPLILPKWWGR